MEPDMGFHVVNQPAQEAHIRFHAGLRGDHTRRDGRRKSVLPQPLRHALEAGHPEHA